jgi:tetratricopeptide (TPR) repeat protein
MGRHLHLKMAVAALATALAAPAFAQLGIDLTPDEKSPSKPPPKPVTMPELNLGARKGDAGKRVAAANLTFGHGDYESAALAYHAILRDPSLGEVHDEARYQLAKSLVKLGLYHSAITQLDELLARGPHGSKYFYNSLEWLFQLGGKVNESVVVSQVARYASNALPTSDQDRFAYLLARYQYERGRALDEAGRSGEAKKSYDEVRRLTAQIRKSTPKATAKDEDAEAVDDGNLAARARFLDGEVLYATGSSQAAVEAFKDVIRQTNPRRSHDLDARIRELAFLQLARIHYEYKQNRYAIFYYDKMPWGGESWLEGLWEASYAHYRIGDYEKALGNLLTLQSPYFREEWFPESWILKAIIYYENCRYPEARAILDEFRANYEGAFNQLEQMTSKQTPPATFYEVLGDAEKKRGAAADPMMRRIFKLALTDQNVKRLSETIDEVEREMDVGLAKRGDAFRSSALAKDLRERLEGERKRLFDEAGGRSRAKLEYERDALRELLQQGLRIKIEVSHKEREALESTLTQGGPVDVIRDYRYSVAVSDEHLYWPYDGEFWRDELGTYTYTLTKGCRDTGARAER